MFLVKSRNIQSPIVLLLYILILSIVCVSASSVPREYGEFKLFQTPVTYDLNSSVSISDEHGSGKTSGYRIEAVVGVEPVWSDQDTDFLLKFHLEVPRVVVWGVREAAVPAAWAAQGSEFYARLTHGAVQTAYLDKRDPLDLLNYKKSIISLFQFRAIDGETKETDVSGTCDVLYESSSLTTIHKTKSGCGEAEDEQWWRRSTYSLSAALDALQAVRAEETIRVGGAGAELRAAALHTLRPRRAAAAAAPAGDLLRALQALPEHLTPQPLTLQPDTQSSEAVEDLSEALSSLRELLAHSEAGEDGAGAGGDPATAAAVLRALPALAAADAPQLLRVLRDAAYQPLLPALCRLLGLAGSAAAHAAAAEQLQLAARDPPRALALHFLAGAALASRPAAGARAALLRLAGSARAPHVAAAATLAVAAQARHADHDHARAVRDFVTKALSRCKDDECRIVRLHALGNLGQADSAEALLSHAERGGRGPALAALDALDALPADALDAARLARVLALAARGGRALEVRAAALAVLLRRAPPAALPGVARALRPAPAELRRVFWQRARQLAADSEHVRAALRTLDYEDRTWNAMANAGTSHVLSRDTGWRLGGRSARLQSAQLAAGGLLRRGVVALTSRTPGEDEREELAVEVWTLGLEAVAGGDERQREALDEGDAGGEGEGGAVRGGLRLRVGGVHAPGLVLFDGQAELLGHIWSGAGSAATPVLRGALARGAAAGRRALLTGGWLHYRKGEVHVFAVDAQAQVSLWSRSARAELELRVAAAAHAQLSVAAPAAAARLRAAATRSAAPRMQLTAHLDFYDGVALCVRPLLHDYQLHRNASAELVPAARGLRAARRVYAERLPAAGRTLALGRLNDVACRHLPAADH